LKPLGKGQPFDSVVGQLHSVIIGPDGGLCMNGVLPRKGIESWMNVRRLRDGAGLRVDGRQNTRESVRSSRWPRRCTDSRLS